jgi:hypothetical protein
MPANANLLTHTEVNFISSYYSRFFFSNKWVLSAGLHLTSYEIPDYYFQTESGYRYINLTLYVRKKSLVQAKNIHSAKSAHKVVL